MDNSGKRGIHSNVGDIGSQPNQNKCYICWCDDQSEEFQLNLCQCSGEFQKKHFSCVVDMILITNDKPCAHCGYRFQDSRITRIEDSIGTVSKNTYGFAHNFWHFVITFGWIGVIDFLMHHILLTRFSQSKSIVCLFYIFLNLFVGFHTITQLSKLKKVRWVCIKDSRNDIPTVHTLDLWTTTPNLALNYSTNPQQVRGQTQQGVNPKSCWICAKQRKDPLITPCVCRNQFAHYRCLTTQLVLSKDSDCQFCGHQYMDPRIRRLPTFENFMTRTLLGTCILFLHILRFQTFVIHSYRTHMRAQAGMYGLCELVINRFLCCAFFSICSICCFNFSFRKYRQWFRKQPKQVLEYVNKNDEIQRICFVNQQKIQ